MIEAGRRQWWQLMGLITAAVAVTAAVWFGFISPAGEEPVEPPTAPLTERMHIEPRQWVRSSSLTPPPSPTPPVEPAPSGLMIPQVPEASTNSGLVIPVVPPQVPAMPPPLEAATAGPRDLDAGVIAGGVPLPKIPSIPTTSPVEITPIPVSTQTVMPEIQVAGYDTLPVPGIPSSAAPSTFALPSPSPTQTSNPPLALMPASTPPPPLSAPPPLAPVIPTTDPVIPTAPNVITPPATVAPAPPALQFPDVIKPVMPVMPDSPLPGANSGITVKTDMAASSAPGTLPTMAIPAAGNPPVISSPGVSPVPVIPSPELPMMLDRPKPLDAVPLSTDKEHFDLPAHQTTSVTKRQGDNNMMTIRGQVAILLSLANLFLSPSPALHAGDDQADKSASTVTSKDVSKLKEQMEEMSKRLDDLSKDYKKLSDKLNETLNGKKDRDGFGLTSDPGVLKDIKTLQDKVSELDTALNKLKTSTSSLRPQSPVLPGPEVAGPSTAPKPRKGTVRIVNEYAVPISMVINGANSYKVEPARARDIEMPVGEFTYQLLEAGGAPVKSFVHENETVTLRIK